MTEYALYLDDGGHPDNQPFFAVAGYVASESQWLAFEPAWKAALARFNLSAPFHMTDFMCLSMSAVKRDQILFMLAQVVKSHTERLFVSAMDNAAYRRVNDEFTLEECHGAPYALTVRGVAGELRDWAKQNLKAEDRLLIFVEEGTKHYGQMEQVLKRDGLPAPVKVPKSLPQVQPSDILAWEAFNYLRAGSPAHLGKNLNRLTRSIRKHENLGSIFYEHDLRRLCKGTDVIPRAKMGPLDTISFHSEKKRKRKRTIF